jgi:alpha-mannosidase
MSSDSGLELNQERTLRYALVPHAGDWRSARVFRDGREFNHPLVCRAVLPHAGTLPKRWGLLDGSHPDVVVSSVKPARDGEVALRLYEASGRAATVRLALSTSLRSARAANLLEDAGAELEIRHNGVRFELHPFEIKSLKLRLAIE